jgi:hypothetical protein
VLDGGWIITANYLQLIFTVPFQILCFKRRFSKVCSHITNGPETIGVRRNADVNVTINLQVRFITISVCNSGSHPTGYKIVTRKSRLFSLCSLCKGNIFVGLQKVSLVNATSFSLHALYLKVLFFYIFFV